MAKFFDPVYDPSKDSGSSGGEVTDLNPERIYDTDLRRIAPEERNSVNSINDQQERVGKFMRAVRTAGAYKQRAGIAEPTIKGRTPRNPVIVDGAEIPSMGDRIGRGGSTNYANKPQPNTGRPFN